MRALLSIGILACSASPVESELAAPTYYRDVQPILQRQCLECHVNDRVAPRVRFETAEGAKSSAALIEEAILLGEMPLFGLDNAGHCGTWREARWLAEEEIATISSWVEAGAPEGDREEARIEAIEAPRMRRDLSLLIPEYTPELGEGAVRCFVIDPALARDRFLTAFEVEVDPEWSVEQVTLSEGEACPEGTRPIAASSWVDRRAGSWIARLPEGTGVRLRAGRKLVVQIHSNLIAGIHPTHVSLALELEDHVTEATLLEVAAGEILLEPGLERTSAAGRVLIREEATLLGVIPRMRLLGQSLLLEVVAPDRRCLADAHHWNTHWFQKLYRYEETIRLTAGSVVRIDCSYTTLGRTEAEGEECRALLYVTSGT
jgi:hypothetical protein